MAGSRGSRQTDNPTPDAPRTILLAEDDPRAVQATAMALKQLGYTMVGPAASGKAAVELARSHRPDMAVLDIRMPDMDGIEAGRIIWGELGIPVVYLSAFAGPEYLQQVMDLGAFGYLIKPATLDDLRVHLGIAWARYRDRIQTRP